MKTNELLRANSNDMLQKEFLYIPSWAKEMIKDSENDEIFIIYSICNRLNGKYFIGITKDIKKTSSEYVNAFLSGNAYNEIIKDMIKFNLSQNFLMTVVEITYDEETAFELEKAIISKYNSIENGYNKSDDAPVNPKEINRPSSSHSIMSRTKNSKMFCGINPSTKQIILTKF